MRPFAQTLFAAYRMHWVYILLQLELTKPIFPGSDEYQNNPDLTVAMLSLTEQKREKNW